MALVRKQRRLNGTRVNYWVCTETGTEYSSKPRVQHWSRANSMLGVLGWAWMADSCGIRELVWDTFQNWHSTTPGRPGISISRLIHLADTSPVLYSCSNPESTNSPEYDAALSALERLVQPYLDEWREDAEWEMQPVQGLSIHSLMQELGYNTENSSGAAPQLPGGSIDVNTLLYSVTK